jgi:hypothetical protein
MDLSELSQYGVKSFQAAIRSFVVISCEIFLFGYQFVLLLRIMGWKGLIGHLKDRGNDNSNSRTNSFQPGEIDARGLATKLIDTELMALMKYLNKEDRHNNSKNQS